MNTSGTHQVVQLDCRHSLVDTRDDLLCNGGSINVLRVKAVAQSHYTGCDLVELHAFLASI